MQCKYPLEACADRKAIRGLWMCERNYCVLKDKPPKQTNADWVRSMSDEELLEFFVEHAMCNVCEFDHKSCFGKRCEEGFERWLQREHTE